MTTPSTVASTIVVISNPASGSSIDDDELRRAFAGHAVTWSPTTEDDPGTGQAKDAVAGGAATVVACGGDGTVRAVLQSLAGTATALGVVPLGTGNLLAGNLGLADGLDAVADAVGGQARRLDVGVVNDERFAVMAGIGFDAMMIRDANSTVKRRFGSIAYVASGAKNLRTRLVPATVAVDGKPVWRGRAVMVLVGNCGTVTGGIEVFPGARPDDGVLDVAVLSPKRRRDWLSVGWSLVRGRPQDPRLVARFRGTAVDVSTAVAMPYELDGEDRDPVRTLRFTIEPASLSVRVPNAATEQAGGQP
jgi:YegS/Rv2252/BmrU family lipid kinase